MAPRHGAGAVAAPLGEAYPLGTMSKTRTEVLEENRKKGIVATAATAGAVAAGVFITPFVGAVAAVPAAYLAYKWWKHRSENGIRV